MNHQGTIALDTPRLLLRRFTVDDAPAMFHNWASDPLVSKYLCWPPHEDTATTAAILHGWVESYSQSDYYNWGIVHRDTNTLIGNISARVLDKTDTLVIGYCLGQPWWGHGYTAEAFIRLNKYFFTEVAANRIEAYHDLNNPNSGKVMQRAGLRYEGISLSARRNNQGIHDIANYALLAREYLNKHATTPPQYTTHVATPADLEPLTDILCELYRRNPRDLLDENRDLLANPTQVFFLAKKDGKPIGVAQTAIRNEYVNGKEHAGPCAYLEAIYVRPEYRHHGIASALVQLCEGWAAEHQCREMLSDCPLDNTDSYLFHRRLGFTETERSIFFRKEMS